MTYIGGLPRNLPVTMLGASGGLSSRTKKRFPGNILIFTPSSYLYPEYLVQCLAHGSSKGDSCRERLLG